MPRPVIQCSRLPHDLVDLVLKEISDDRKTLEHCSLVCWEWSRAAGPYIFSPFSWPPCSTKIVGGYCEKDPRFAEDSSFTVLLQSLASSPRLCHSIRKLTLSHHDSDCAYGVSENDGSLYSTFFRIISFLPNLHTLTLNGNNIGPLSSDDLDFIKDHTVDVRTLSLFCSISAVPYLLCAFRSVSRLVLRCLDVPNQPLIPRAQLSQLKVQYVNISLSSPAEVVMSVLQHCLDITAIRHLTWHSEHSVASHPRMLDIIADMSSLESVTHDLVRSCQSSGIHREPLVHPQLRSITLRGKLGLLSVKHSWAQRREYISNGLPDRSLEELLEEPLSAIRGGGVDDSSWQAILEDLRILVSPMTRDLTIRLTLAQQYEGGPDAGGDDDDDEWYVWDETPAHGVRALRKGLSAVDWAGLQAAVARSIALQSVRFVIEFPGAVSYHDCVEILRRHLALHLSEDVMGKVQFVDETDSRLLLTMYEKVVVAVW